MSRQMTLGVPRWGALACACSVLLGALLADATAAWRTCKRLRRQWARVGPVKAQLLAQRRRDFCPAQSISYANTDPLLVVEGYGSRLVDEARLCDLAHRLSGYRAFQFLPSVLSSVSHGSNPAETALFKARSQFRRPRKYSQVGRVFLDTRNNVAHVGHAHPAVSKAVGEQAMLVNTNTRYLHMNVCALARLLLDTMPAPLRDGVVFFVNSGSEANDLALRCVT